ncbi:DUF4331 domain-containing protein [Motilibacter rhizosphaerae]|uniref:DUF4331 domain-containing protein n=1 Tax=Motilibacter rhizosphaerae TaxID=598652 RepID=UPI0018C8A462|nr:DUF4331 domain-containing protein [Motilibacter rhizosphaerae]
MSPSLLRRAAPVALSSLALLSAGVALAPTASASSHREAPLISGMPKDDATDVYAFRSPDAPDTLTILGNFIPFEDPAGGPNFYPFDDDALYNINIDNDGDGKADIVYQFEFSSSYQNPGTFLYNTGPVTSLTDPDLNFRQIYTVRRIEGGSSPRVLHRAPVAPSYVGAASMPDYASLRQQAVVPFDRSGATGTSFAGQADDPFFLDLRVFDLLYGGNLSEVGNDSLRGYNVNTLGIQVPIKDLVKDGDPVVGVWTTVTKENAKRQQVQVSRLGNPLVNEVVIPVKDKDAWNASKPQDDAQFAPYVTAPELPHLLNAVYGLPVPAEPRNDLVSVFLTGVKGLNQPAHVTPAEELRVNTSTPVAAHPDRLGVLGGDVQGFPNGRRLGDDVIDISLQAVAGELVGYPNDLGDGVDANDAGFTSSFPYVALPHSGSIPKGSDSTSVSLLTGGSGHHGGNGPGALRSAAPGLVGTAAAGLLLLGLTGTYARRRRSVTA